MTFDIDEDPIQADWLRREWPQTFPNNPEAMRKLLEGVGMPVDQFRQSPVYKFNVDKMPWLKDV